MSLDRLRRIAGIIRVAQKVPSEFEGDRTRAAEISLRTSRKLLGLLGVEYECTGAPVHSGPVLFVGNHISYLDVLLLYTQTHVSFLAKKEVGSWPVFGKVMHAAGTVFVQRDNSSSRTQARQAISHAILNEGRKIAIFPEGTTSLAGRPWRYGPLEVAQKEGITVQPFRVRYSNPRVCAFIDDDAFVPHLWKILSTSGLRGTLDLGEPLLIQNPAEDAVRLQKWASPT